MSVLLSDIAEHMRETVVDVGTYMSDGKAGELEECIVYSFGKSHSLVEAFALLIISINEQAQQDSLPFFKGGTHKFTCRHFSSKYLHCSLYSNRLHTTSLE